MYRNEEDIERLVCDLDKEYSSESKDIWHDANPSKDIQNTALKTPAYCSRDAVFYYPNHQPPTTGGPS